MTSGPVSETGRPLRGAGELEDMLERDLLGPWDGPTEELPAGTTPGERYLLGQAGAAPRRKAMSRSRTDGAAEDDDVEDRPSWSRRRGPRPRRRGPGGRATPAAVRGRAMAASSLGRRLLAARRCRRRHGDGVLGPLRAGPVRHPNHRYRAARGRCGIAVPAGGIVDIPIDCDAEAASCPGPGAGSQVHVRWRVRHYRDRRGRRGVPAQRAAHVPPDLPDRAAVVPGLT